MGPNVSVSKSKLDKFDYYRLWVYTCNKEVY